MAGHPLQHRVGHHDVGVRRRRPVPHVGLLGGDPPLARRGHHLRRRVQRAHRRLRPAGGQHAGEVAGPAAEVDDPPRRRRPRPGRAGRGTGASGGRRSRGRAPGPRWCSRLARRTLVACALRGATGRRRCRATCRTAAVVGAGVGAHLQDHAVAARHRCAARTRPHRRAASRWCRLRIEPVTRLCTASGTRPGVASRNRRGGSSAMRTAPSTVSRSAASTTVRVPDCQVTLLSRCQPTRRAPPSGSVSQSPSEVVTQRAAVDRARRGQHPFLGVQPAAEPGGQLGPAEQPLQLAHWCTLFVSEPGA